MDGFDVDGEEVVDEVVVYETSVVEVCVGSGVVVEGGDDESHSISPKLSQYEFGGHG